MTMSRNQRIALVGAAIAVAVIAFVIASSGAGDEDGGATNASQTQTRGGGGSAQQPQVERIAIVGNEVKGGVRSIHVKKGSAVRIVVSVDKPNTLHLHGYDIEKEATPHTPARFVFAADIEGVFELESHTFEDAGLEAGVAKLVVEPA
jgi:hypothetical protein